MFTEHQRNMGISAWTYFGENILFRLKYELTRYGVKASLNQETKKSLLGWGTDHELETYDAKLK